MLKWILLPGFFLWICFFRTAVALPDGFVYLYDVDPSIIQDIRYAGYYNFIGRPINGYERGTCILTKQAAAALSAIQKKLRSQSLSLKVYDCYRPTRAVADFVAWSRNPRQMAMKQPFYPNINKADLFKLGYIALQSGHSRGSTVDLTIVALPPKKQLPYKKGVFLPACDSVDQIQHYDNTINMGSGYDCLDPISHITNRKMSRAAYHHRLFLREKMIENGFKPYDDEWWHFTLENEPYPNTYFNFPVS
jgi:D-alanyl-D-alanine dipeptidase